MKAILIVDMPKTCKDCKLTYLDTGDDAYYGSPTQRCIFDGAEADVNERYYDCPLKPMPHSKQMENRWFSDDYSKGWNECLEEIENG